MIPKVIHYCWFGRKPLDKLGGICLESWRKYFPDYEIVCWDESNTDLQTCKYVREAYCEKKWAFISDYVRFKVLYEKGGLYFDTDVEVLKSFDDILDYGSFMGCEYTDSQTGIRVAPGLGIAAEPGLPLYKEIIDDYESSSFYNSDGTMNLYDVVMRTTNILKKHGLENVEMVQKIDGINIYPSEYFCPINTNSMKANITNNTHSIHHYAASWTTPSQRFNKKMFAFLCRVIGEEKAIKIRSILKTMLR